MKREVLRQHERGHEHESSADDAHDDSQLWPGKRAPAQPDASAADDQRLVETDRLRTALLAMEGTGATLPGPIATRMSRLLGADLSAVRVHTTGPASAAAATLRASAFTHGAHIAFAPGGYSPSSARSRFILAHELVHVVQNQRAGGAAMRVAARLDVGPSGSSIEREADAGASALMRGEAFAVEARGGLPGLSLLGEHEQPSAPEALDGEALERKVHETLEARADADAKATYARTVVHVGSLRERAQQLTLAAPAIAAPTTKRADAPAVAAKAPATSTAATTAPATPRRVAASSPAVPAAQATRGATPTGDHAGPAEAPTPARPVLEVPTRLEADTTRLKMWPSQLESLRATKAALIETRRQTDQQYDAVKRGADPVLATRLEEKLAETRRTRDVAQTTERQPEAGHDEPSVTREGKPPAPRDAKRDAPRTPIKQRPPLDPTAQLEQELQTTIAPKDKPLADAMIAAREVVETEQQLDQAITRGERYVAAATEAVRRELREGPQHAAPQRETPQRETPQRKTPQRETPQRDVIEAPQRDVIEAPQRDATQLDATQRHPTPLDATQLEANGNVVDATQDPAPVEPPHLTAQPTPQHAPNVHALTQHQHQLPAQPAIADGAQQLGRHLPEVQPAIADGAQQLGRHLPEVQPAIADGLALDRALPGLEPVIFDGARPLEHHLPDVQPAIAGTARALDHHLPGLEPAIVDGARQLDRQLPTLQPAIADGARQLDRALPGLEPAIFDGARQLDRHLHDAQPAIAQGARDGQVSANTAPPERDPSGKPALASPADQAAPSERGRAEQAKAEEQKRNEDGRKANAIEGAKVEEDRKAKVADDREQDRTRRRAETDAHSRTIDNTKHPELALIQRDVLQEASATLAAVSPRALGLRRGRGDADDLAQRRGLDPAKLRAVIAPTIHEVLPGASRFLRPGSAEHTLVKDGAATLTRVIDRAGVLDPTNPRDDANENAQLRGRLSPMLDDDSIKAGEAYEPMSPTAPAAPQARAPGRGGPGPAPKAPEPPPQLPPELRSGNQAAIHAFVEQQRKAREASRAKVAGTKLAQCALVPIDANAIALQVKAKNDTKLQQIRAKAEADKATASAEAAAKKQEGPVSIESLKEKLETEIAADKATLKQTFETQQAELKARLETQREVLDKGTLAQTDQIKKEQAARKAEAEKAWNAEKKNLEATNLKLVGEIRKTCEADQAALKKQEVALAKVTDGRIAAIHMAGAKRVSDVLGKGTEDAAKAIKAGKKAASIERKKGKALAANVRAIGELKAAKTEDSFEQMKIRTAAGYEAFQIESDHNREAKFYKTQGMLSAEAIMLSTKTGIEQVSDETKRAAKEAQDKALQQGEAIKTKIDGLIPLGEQKIADAGKTLTKQLADGQKALDATLKGSTDKIEASRKEGETKIGKTEGDAAKQLQADYDRELKAIDQRLETARKALAAGNARNLQALERMVDQTCKAIDSNIATAEKRMAGHVATAEKQAQTVMLAQLGKIKAEADKALQEIDKAFAQTMKMVDDAIEAAHRQLEETAEGKMLEIEVHVATMFKDTGDSKRYDAVKKQLAWYVEHKQPIPQGFAQQARDPAKDTEDADKKEGDKDAKKDGDKADDKKDGDKDAKKDGDKADDKDAKKDGDKKEGDKPSQEEIDKEVEALIKRGQTDTSVGAAAAATAKIETAYEGATTAIEKVSKERAEKLKKVVAGDPAERAEVEQYYKDVKSGEEAADNIKKAMEREHWLVGKDPDKKAIMKALEGKNKREIEVMRKVLAEKGVDLDAIVKSEFDGDEQTEAKIRLQGNPKAADISALGLNGGYELSGNQKLGATLLVPGAGLVVALNGDSAIGANKDRIREILERNKGDMKSFAEDFEKQTGKPLAEFLRQNGMADECKGLNVPKVDRDEGTSEEIKAKAAEAAAKAKADADKEGTPINAKAASASVNKLQDAIEGFHLDGTKSDSVREALAGKSPGELAFIRAQYKAETGRDLDRDLEANLSGAALVEAKATLRSDKTQAAVAKILGSEEASLTPWTVDDKKMQDALKELTDPKERRAVLAAYKERTGHDLSEVIADKMTGNDEKLAKALYEGDELKARMVELDEATNGGWMNSMHQTIAERTGLDTEGFTRQLAGVAIGGIPGKTYTIGGYEIGNGSIHKVDSDKMFEILEQTKSPADRARLKALYKAETGRELDDDMAHKLVGPSGDKSKFDAYTALSEGRTDDYHAARMDDALSGLNDTGAFHKQLEGKSQWERKAIIDAYNKRHGNNPNAFAELCADQLGGIDQEKANLLATSKDDIKTGVVKLPEEFVLRYAQDSVWTKASKMIDDHTQIFDKYPILYALPVVGYAALQVKTASYFMRGWGVDSGAIKDVFKDKTKAEIDELLAKHPELKADLQYVMSGRDAYELELMFEKGKPQTKKEEAERALALYDFDRGKTGEWFDGSSKIQNGIVDLFSPSGRIMDAEAANLREQIELLSSNKELSAAQKFELDYALGSMSSSTENFITAREAVTGAIATAVGAVVGAVATVITGGAAAPFVAALMSGLSTVAVKMVMMGKAYGRNDIGVDLAMMAVQVATAGIGANAQTFLAEVVSGGLQNMIQSFVSSAITAQDAHDLMGLLAAASKSGLVGFVSGAAGAAAQSALDGAMEKLGKKLFKADVFGEDASLSAAFVKGFVGGGGSAVASMMVEAVNDPSMLEGNWDSVFANVMRTGAEGGMGGALSGAAGAYAKKRQAAKDAVAAAKKVQAEGGSIAEQQQAFLDAGAKAAHDEMANPPVEDAPKTADQIADHLADAPPIVPDRIIDLSDGAPDAPPIVPDRIIDLDAPAIVPDKIVDVGEPAAKPKVDDDASAGKPTDGDATRKDGDAKPTDGDAEPRGKKMSFEDEANTPPRAAFEDTSNQFTNSAAAKTEHGTVRAQANGDNVKLTFPADLPVDQRAAYARDAMERLGITPAPGALVDLSKSPVEVPSQLRAASPEEARQLADKLFDRNRAGDDDLATDQRTPAEQRVREAQETVAKGEVPFAGKCTELATNWQKKFAEQGLHAPIVNAKHENDGHRYLVVGDTIVDPSFGQFAGGKVVDGQPNQYEPFVGTYDEMRTRIQKMMDDGQMPGYASAEQALAEGWGLGPPRDGKPFELMANVEPFGGATDVRPQSADDVRRLMAEQRALGIEPGQGLPRDLVDQVKAQDDGATRTPDAEPGWKLPTPDDANRSPEDIAHLALVNDRAAKIMAEDPSLSMHDAHRRARNEVLADIHDTTPGPVATAAKDLDAAVRAGNGEAAVAAIEGLTDLGQRRAMLQDLRRAHDGASLDKILASLPDDHRVQVQKHLDSLRANPDHVVHAQKLVEAQAKLRDEFQRLSENGASQAECDAALDKLIRARQDAVDALTDVYGIDDSQVRQREGSSLMGYGMDRGSIAPKKVGGEGLAEAMPTGNVILRNAGDGLFIDPITGLPRSAAFIASALGHEVEIHIEQLRDQRYTELKKLGAVDTGTAINEAEAYGYMLREGDRFGLSSEERALIQKRYDDQLGILEKHDPDAYARVLEGDFSVPGHEVVHDELAPRQAWGGDAKASAATKPPSDATPPVTTPTDPKPDALRNMRIADLDGVRIDVQDPHGRAHRDDLAAIEAQAEADADAATDARRDKKKVDPERGKQISLDDADVRVARDEANKRPATDDATHLESDLAGAAKLREIDPSLTPDAALARAKQQREERAAVDQLFAEMFADSPAAKQHAEQQETSKLLHEMLAGTDAEAATRQRAVDEEVQRLLAKDPSLDPDEAQDRAKKRIQDRAASLVAALEGLFASNDTFGLATNDHKPSELHSDIKSAGDFTTYLKAAIEFGQRIKGSEDGGFKKKIADALQKSGSKVLGDTIITGGGKVVEIAVGAAFGPEVGSMAGQVIDQLKAGAHVIPDLAERVGDVAKALARGDKATATEGLRALAELVTAGGKVEVPPALAAELELISRKADLERAVEERAATLRELGVDPLAAKREALQQMIDDLRPPAPTGDGDDHDVRTPEQVTQDERIRTLEQDLVTRETLARLATDDPALAAQLRDEAQAVRDELANLRRPTDADGEHLTDTHSDGPDEDWQLAQARLAAETMATLERLSLDDETADVRDGARAKRLDAEREIARIEALREHRAQLDAFDDASGHELAGLQVAREQQLGPLKGVIDELQAQVDAADTFGKKIAPQTRLELAQAQADYAALTQRHDAAHKEATRRIADERARLETPPPMPRTPAEIAQRKADVQQARGELDARDAALAADVHGKTVAHGGQQHVEQVFDHVTIGAGFAGVANELSRPGRGANDILIGGKNPWDGATSKFGQKAGDSELPNHAPGQGMTETNMDPSARYMDSSDHGDNVALNKNAAKLATYDGKVGPIESGPDTSWPDFAQKSGATARFPVVGPDGETRYFYTKTADVAGGPGPNRVLSEAILDPATLARMKQDGVFAFGDQTFRSDTLRTAGEIGIFGPGAAGAWAGEATASVVRPGGERANQIEWLGVHPQLNHQTDEAAHATLKDLKAEYADAKRSGDRERIAAANAAMTKFLFEEAAGNGFLPRNREPGGAHDPQMQTENGGNISQRAVEGIAKITYEPHPDHPGAGNRVKITLKDVDASGQPIVIWKDALVMSIGQEATGAGGPAQLVQNYNQKLVPILGAADEEGFRPVVGVTSKDGSIRVLGAAATPRDVAKLMDQRSMSTDEHQGNLRRQAGELSADSKGVVGGFVLAQQTIAAANHVLGEQLTKSRDEQKTHGGVIEGEP